MANRRTKKRSKKSKPTTSSKQATNQNATAQPTPKVTQTTSRKSRREQAAAAKRTRQIRAFGLGALALAVILVAGIWVTQRPSAEQVAMTPLEGTAIDGSVDAPIQIVEFGDFGCHACRQWHALGVKEQIQAEYGDQVAFSFRHFPVITAQSPLAAEASQCAAEQGMFWEYHDFIYESTPEGALSEGDLKQYASAVSLDRGAFDICLESERYQAHVVADSQAARAAGARGTPTFLVNGQQVNPTYNTLSAAIDALLAP